MLAVMAMAGVLSLLPLQGVPSGPTGADKIAHFVLYAVLAFVTCRAAGKSAGRPGRGRDRRQRAPRAPAAIVATGFAVAVVFGGAMEWLQGAVGRDPSWGDLFANAAGAAAGAAIWWLRHARQRRISGVTNLEAGRPYE